MSRLSNDDWLALVEIARRSIASVILERRVPEFPPFPAKFSEPRGAFVSLYCGGKLRGCVGQVEDPGPLADVVARVAISAALHDSRFAPITPQEVPALKIEISVLSVPERISPEAIVAGRHGLLVVRGTCRGVLLPHVASARNWSGERLLEETCVKAGLAGDIWHDPATAIFGFTAEVFSEKDTVAIPDIVK
jgi:AmmeMemoRadiSam system protein A